MRPMPAAAPRARFAHVETWVFDLDNTLYPHHLNLWQQVDERIRDYIADFLKSAKTKPSACRRTTTSATAPRCAA